MRVICVDDEQSTLVNLEYDLKQREDIESLHTFISPLIALDHAKAHKVDLAFLDIQMPEMTGLELGEELKAIYPNVLLVFLTAEEKHEDEADQVGALVYLLKPYMDEELDAVLELVKTYISE